MQLHFEVLRVINFGMAQFTSLHPSRPDTQTSTNKEGLSSNVSCNTQVLPMTLTQKGLHKDKRDSDELIAFKECDCQVPSMLAMS